MFTEKYNRTDKLVPKIRRLLTYSQGSMAQGIQSPKWQGKSKGYLTTEQLLQYIYKKHLNVNVIFQTQLIFMSSNKCNIERI